MDIALLCLLSRTIPFIIFLTTPFFITFLKTFSINFPRKKPLIYSRKSWTDYSQTSKDRQRSCTACSLRRRNLRKYGARSLIRYWKVPGKIYSANKKRLSEQAVGNISSLKLKDSSLDTISWVNLDVFLPHVLLYLSGQ